MYLIPAQNSGDLKNESFCVCVYFYLMWLWFQVSQSFEVGLPESPSTHCFLKSLKGSEMRRNFTNTEVMKVNLRDGQLDEYERQYKT